MACVVVIHLYEGRCVKSFEHDGTVKEGQDYLVSTIEAARDLNLEAFPIELNNKTMMIYPEHISYWEILSVTDNI